MILHKLITIYYDPVIYDYTGELKKGKEKRGSEDPLKFAA
jgi:hypothetical protein